MISIILASYNGAERLPLVLASLAVQKDIESIEFELIVVDNASTDETRNVIVENKCKYSWLKYVKEENLGLNYARNRGVLEAKGNVLIFVDDDITFCNTWLLAYYEFFRENFDAVLAGGRVTPLISQNIEIPAWLALDGEYAFPYITVTVDHGNSIIPISLATGAMPVGANMAIKKQIFEQYGLFRTDLGLKGKSLMPGAEYDFFSRLGRSNLEWFYIPNAQVYHPVKTSQLSQSYFLKRTFGVGRVATKTMILPEKTRKIGPVPLFCFCLLLEKTFHYLASLPSANQKKKFHRKAQVYKASGMIYEWIAPRIN